jgi:hypothetical protein
MKLSIKIFVFGLIIISLMGCSEAKTPSPDEPPNDQTEYSEETEIGYPISPEGSTNQGYPLENNESTEIPAYLLPEFITATPDPALVSIIISEVRHENGLETIVIKNIGEEQQDISAFMIYSPAIDDRKILPQNIVLDTGDTFMLYNGPDTSAYPESQRWLKETILNEALDEVWLLNDAARIVYYFVYYPPVSE